MSDYANIEKKFNEAYYDSANKISENIFENPGFSYIFEKIKNCHSVLEVGCGTGIKLNQLTSKNQEVHGCDINSYAIERAKKEFPHINFFVQDSTAFSVADCTYDAVMSFFVLEHVQNSENFINELLRITKKDGIIAIMCPNYGSPFFPSPPSKYKKGGLQKILLYIQRFSNILRYHVTKKEYTHLEFKAVTPITHEYKTDYDTVVEPYLYDLQKFIESKNHKVQLATSLWEVQSTNTLRTFFYLPLKLIGKIGIGKYWGPQICIIIQK